MFGENLDEIRRRVRLVSDLAYRIRTINHLIDQLLDEIGEEFRAEIHHTPQEQVQTHNEYTQLELDLKPKGYRSEGPSF